MVKKHTGLQKDVLRLYKQCLKAAYEKPPEHRDRFVLFVRKGFHDQLRIERRDFGTVEHLLRKGTRMLEIYGDKNVKNISM